ncbi:anthranilate phosphoribosyltransferase [Dehalobacter sp. DCM]|uniref:anthranilate phosphoribosyltransferase n=1 Tax=Dehalobacter sp. DCM TaxID=2907827 RepID=UPI003081F600|nr:anthranilate phosphoribosyltransferase [Dehalobacter sp. DCM]
MGIEKALKILSEKGNLSDQLAYESMNEMMSGEASEVSMAAFLTALRIKGETIDEIYGTSKVMREKALKVQCVSDNLVDTCGTGGDGAHTFNISTTAMFVAACNGIKIAKHGNRSITSKSGAADVLEALGAEITSSPEEIRECIDQVGIGFMFAPHFHASMKYAMPVRKALGFKTIFNILGPLSNPAGAKRQLLGVYDRNLVRVVAEVLKKHEAVHALVVHGSDGLDEITLTGPTYAAELKDGMVTEYIIHPEDYGFALCTSQDLAGGTPQENAQITLYILSGVQSPKADTVILNAGAAIYIGGKANSLQQGIEMARMTLAEQSALPMLQKFIAKTRKNI